VHAELGVSWITRLIRHDRLPNVAEIDYSSLYVLIKAQREGLRTLPLRRFFLIFFLLQSDELPRAATFLLAFRTHLARIPTRILTVPIDVLRGFLQYTRGNSGTVAQIRPHAIHF
jgi:hypothetical protein